MILMFNSYIVGMFFEKYVFILFFEQFDFYLEGLNVEVEGGVVEINRDFIFFSVFRVAIIYRSSMSLTLATI